MLVTQQNRLFVENFNRELLVFYFDKISEHEIIS